MSVIDFILEFPIASGVIFGLFLLSLLILGLTAIESYIANTSDFRSIDIPKSLDVMPSVELEKGTNDYGEYYLPCEPGRCNKREDFGNGHILCYLCWLR